MYVGTSTKLENCPIRTPAPCTRPSRVESLPQNNYFPPSNSKLPTSNSDLRCALLTLTLGPSPSRLRPPSFVLRPPASPCPPLFSLLHSYNHVPTSTNDGLHHSTKQRSCDRSTIAVVLPALALGREHDCCGTYRTTSYSCGQRQVRY